MVRLGSWQEFEHASREIIRSMGYYVHPGPFVTHQKEVDIYARHHRFYSWVDGELRPDLFIGECKHWSGRVGASVIYELKGLLDNIRSDHHVRGAVFSSNGASVRAVEAAKAVDIMIFDDKDIEMYLEDIFRQKEAGEIERPSFPGYWKLSKLMEVVGAITEGIEIDNEFYSGDIRSVLSNQFAWSMSSVRDWTTSLLNVAALLGIIDFMGKDGNKNMFKQTKETEKLFYLWEQDQNKVIEVLRPVVLKNIFVREVIYYLLIQGPTKRNEIGKALEYTRPGFDAESIFMAMALARDFYLIERVDPDNQQSPLQATENARVELWGNG